MIMDHELFINRELSWLSFNYRVLQEAKSPEVPLMERIQYLAIYASNLDEFFKVRVATIKRLIQLQESTKNKLKEEPERVLKAIRNEVKQQREEFNQIFRKSIIHELTQEGIYFLNENQLDEVQQTYVKEYFKNQVNPRLDPVMLTEDETSLFLKDDWIYFAILLKKPDTGELAYALLELPEALPRFIELPSRDSNYFVLLIDDLIRFNLPDLFAPYTETNAYAFRVLRDAELDIEGDVSESLLKKILKSLEQREQGAPTRLSYDPEMAAGLLNLLSKKTDIETDDSKFPRRYHDFTDFFNFPFINWEHLRYQPMPPLPDPEMEINDDLFSLVEEKDRLVHFPYQKFQYVLQMLRQAGDDPHVTHIEISLYRLAKDSKIVYELIRALKNGKYVLVVIELKARFDEASNIYWFNKLEEAGADLIYSHLNLKVHCKVLLIKRKEGANTNKYAFLSTGNFNEDTAKLYGDIGLFTVDKRITEDAANLLDVYIKRNEHVEFDHFLVSPLNLRQKLYDKIEREIKNAKAGKTAYIILKANSLQDRKMINKLYKASEAGVAIYLIIRSICCLKPGIPEISTNIQAISIVDRILEHARVYVFGNDGHEEMYLSSADWMKRNLDKRIEVAFPVFDQDLRYEIKNYLQTQLKDNVKGRILDADQKNEYNEQGIEKVRSQYLIYEYYKEMVNEVYQSRTLNENPLMKKDLF